MVETILLISLILFILLMIKETKKKMIKEWSDVVGGGDNHLSLIIWLYKGIIILLIIYLLTR